mmetsp:Transcript_1224/g.5185  ORF Transcript_1224/g.5185 Transcript_1224/m.5185 type:complete len:624 (+) Transcript_1224:1882-3753(+)
MALLEERTAERCREGRTPRARLAQRYQDLVIHADEPRPGIVGLTKLVHVGPCRLRARLLFGGNPIQAQMKEQMGVILLRQQLVAELRIQVLVQHHLHRSVETMRIQFRYDVEVRPAQLETVEQGKADARARSADLIYGLLPVVISVVHLFVAAHLHHVRVVLLQRVHINDCAGPREDLVSDSRQKPEKPRASFGRPLGVRQMRIVDPQEVPDARAGERSVTQRHLQRRQRRAPKQRDVARRRRLRSRASWHSFLRRLHAHPRLDQLTDRRGGVEEAREHHVRAGALQLLGRLPDLAEGDLGAGLAPGIHSVDLFLVLGRIQEASDPLLAMQDSASKRNSRIHATLEARTAKRWTNAAKELPPDRHTGGLALRRGRSVDVPVQEALVRDPVLKIGCHVHQLLDSRLVHFVSPRVREGLDHRWHGDEVVHPEAVRLPKENTAHPTNEAPACLRVGGYEETRIREVQVPRLVADVLVEGVVVGHFQQPRVVGRSILVELLCIHLLLHAQGLELPLRLACVIEESRDLPQQILKASLDNLGVHLHDTEARLAVSRHVTDQRGGVGRERQARVHPHRRLRVRKAGGCRQVLESGSVDAGFVLHVPWRHLVRKDLHLASAEARVAEVRP